MNKFIIACGVLLCGFTLTTSNISAEEAGFEASWGAKRHSHHEEKDCDCDEARKFPNDCSGITSAVFVPAQTVTNTADTGSATAFLGAGGTAPNGSCGCEALVSFNTPLTFTSSTTLTPTTLIPYQFTTDGCYLVLVQGLLTNNDTTVATGPVTVGISTTCPSQGSTSVMFPTPNTQTTGSITLPTLPPGPFALPISFSAKIPACGCPCGCSTVPNLFAISVTVAPGDSVTAGPFTVDALNVSCSCRPLLGCPRPNACNSCCNSCSCQSCGSGWGR